MCSHQWIKRSQVCNHPDLFEGRPIVSAFDMWGLDQRMPSVVLGSMEDGPLETVFKIQAARAAGFQLPVHQPSALWAMKEVKVRSPPLKRNQSAQV